MARVSSVCYNVQMAHKPTEKLKKYVLEAARARVNQAKIADALGIDGKTLRKHYRKQLTDGRMDLVRLATNKVVEFLELPTETPDGERDTDLAKEQAAMGEKVMRSHGWARAVELEGLTELPQINVTILPKEDTDI